MYTELKTGKKPCYTRETAVFTLNIMNDVDGEKHVRYNTLIR